MKTKSAIFGDINVKLQIISPSCTAQSILHYPFPLHVIKNHLQKCSWTRTLIVPEPQLWAGCYM